MNNMLKYFYNIDTSSVKFKDNYYYFIHDSYLYKLYITHYIINENEMYLLNKNMLKHTLVSEIILNKDGKIITEDNNNRYILLKIYVASDKLITLDDIEYLANLGYTVNANIDWSILWSKKIDYLENLINENGKKYPIIADSFNYFVGMAENAIAYYNNTSINSTRYVISHKRIGIKSSLEDLYNPLNIIFDYQIRDISEYVKSCFFENKKEVLKILNRYFSNKNLNLSDIRLFVARLMYPSFYFDLYEDILVNGKSEKIILPIVRRLEEYQLYLSKIITYLKQFYNIEEIEWLNKNNISPH